MPTSKEKASRSSDRAQYRPTAEQKELLVQAAMLAGQSLSDFMRTAVEERAQRIIADHERIVLSASERATFFAALDNPGDPPAKLISLLKRYRAEVTSL
jgi:uncharacterized protein (DUF1778 family)